MKEIIALSILIPTMLITLFALQQPVIFALQLGIFLPLVVFQCASQLTEYWHKKAQMIHAKHNGSYQSQIH